MALLVGDNPFHGISHLSQERARVRQNRLTSPEYASDLVMTCIQNGANGFMFSVSETTLSILREIHEKVESENLRLYAIVPYAYEYVRLANKLGGTSGIAKKLAKDIIASRNFAAVTMGLKGVMTSDTIPLMKAYLSYEMSRIKSSARKRVNLQSVLLHEVITDMALALNFESLFKSYVEFMLRQGVTPGFNTGNFVQLIRKFREWHIDLRKTTIATPFNKVGFQMTPSKTDCEKALESLPESIVVAISIFAAGYLKPLEAINYVATLSNLEGVAVGVSNECHATETFRFLKEKFGQALTLQ